MFSIGRIMLGRHYSDLHFLAKRELTLYIQDLEVIERLVLSTCTQRLSICLAFFNAQAGKQAKPLKGVVNYR